MLIQSYAFCASLRPPWQRSRQCFHCKLEIEVASEPESQAEALTRAYPFRCRSVPEAAHSVLARTRNRNTVSDSNGRFFTCMKKPGRKGRWWEGPVHQLLEPCPHDQPSGGLTWHRSEHAAVRIYSGKERDKRIMDIGALFHLPSPGPEICGAGGWDSNSPYAFFWSRGMKC